jgi:Cu(I)/Ag(I) efflux system membrane fusion protein
VWVYLEVYEVDLAWVRYGQRVRVTAQALPGRAFEGLVTFVQPLVDESTRTVRVPVHVENQDHALKPGMFVTAVIEARLTAQGAAAATGIEGRFTCPMHPQVLAPEAGACPLCEMALELVPGAGPTEGHTHEDSPVAPAPVFACTMECEGEKTYSEPGSCPVCNMRLEPRGGEPSPTAEGVLAVPVTAVLDSGTRALVYVELERGRYEPRELVLGPRAGAYQAVLAGLTEGERVVTRGNFLIDSQFQINGQPSLFYPRGLHGDAEEPPATPHDHDGAR